MELKRDSDWGTSRTQKLLIVPYGIETRLQGAHLNKLLLLIVPYGIETIFAFATKQKKGFF